MSIRHLSFLHKWSNSPPFQFCTPGKLELNDFLPGRNLQAEGIRGYYLVGTRHEQYYWVGYWYWVILGCYQKLVLVLGIVKPFCKIGIGIGYC